MSKLRLFGHSFLWLFTVSLVVIAITLIAARLFLVQVTEYKQDLELHLSQEVGASVSIEKLAARMDGFTPQVRLINVRISNANDTAVMPLSIGEIRVELHPLRALLKGSLIPDKLTLVDTFISIQRFADGHIALMGLPLSGVANETDANGDFSWLLEEAEVEIINSNILWRDETRAVDDLLLTEANLVLKNTADFHQLDISAVLSRESPKPIRLSIAIQGDVLSSDNAWGAKGYLKAERLNVSSILERLDNDSYSSSNGVAGIEVWVEWENARLQQIQGSINLDQAHLKYAEHQLVLDDAAGQFKWLRTANGWQFYSTDVAYKTNGLAQHNSKLSLGYFTLENEAYRLELASDNLDSEVALTLLMQANVLDEKQSNTLYALGLKGVLNNTRVSYQHHPTQQQWFVCSDIEGFSNKAKDSLPGFDNFAGKLCATQDNGWFSLDSQGAVITFNELFENPLDIVSAKGLLQWQHDSQGWKITTDYLALNSPYISSQTRMNLLIPKAGGAARLNMQTNFGDIASVDVLRLLPVGILSDKLAKWLNTSIQGGQGLGGAVVFRGAVNDFPFRQKTGVFQTLFRVKDGTLDYARQWPKLTNIVAEIEFKNEGMQILASEGEIAGSKVAKAIVSIDDLDKKDNYLNIKGNVNDDVKGLFTFFRQSPIKAKLGALLNSSDVSGKAEIDVDLKVALDGGKHSSIVATAVFDNASLAFPRLDLSVNNIKGVMRYGKKGLFGEKLSANVLKQNVVVDISSTSKNTYIKANGKFSAENILKQFSFKSAGKIRGESTLALTVSVPHSGLSGGAALINISSNLKGLSLDFPEPLRKTKNQSRPSEVSIKLGNKLLPIELSYSDKLQGSFLFKEGRKGRLQLQRGDIHLGKGAALLPAKQGLQLSGHLNELDVNVWEQELGLNENKGSQSIVNQLNLKVGRLVWSEKVLNDFDIQGYLTKGVWAGEIGSDELVGRYSIPFNANSKEIIKLDLEKLVLPQFDSSGEQADVDFDPRKIPSIDLNIKHLSMGGANFGSLQLEAKKTQKGLSINKFLLSSKRDQLQASGRWETTKKGQITEFKGQLKSDSLGGLLRDADLSDDLEGAPVTLTFNFDWLGSPAAFSKDIINGSLKIKSGAGRLLNLEPGAGRVLGLFSLSTLQRRLRLDFSDLVQKGFSFDKVKGNFTIIDGDAKTDRFYIEGPSSRLSFKGRIGLKAEDYDQTVTVTPKTTESLPLAGALAAGPIVGAAVFVVQKIAGKTINKLVDYQYRITGTWANPEIKQLSTPGGSFIGNVIDKVLPKFDSEFGSESDFTTE